MRSCFDGNPLHPDEIKIFCRLPLNLQAKFNRFPNPGHQFVKGAGLGMAPRQSRHRGDESALRIALDDNVKLAGHIWFRTPFYALTHTACGARPLDHGDDLEDVSARADLRLDADPSCAVRFRAGSFALAMEKSSVIVSNPEIMGGTPALTGTRVPFQTLLDYLESGAPLEEFLEDFPSVSRGLAVAALKEAGDLALAHARAA